MPRRLAAAAKLLARTTSTNRKTWFRSSAALRLFLDFTHPIMPYSRGINAGPMIEESTRKWGNAMAKVLVLYYSSYGHIETMANAVAEGARSAGATVDVKRVPETLSAEVAKASHYKIDQQAPVAKIDELANYDAIIIGS